MSAGACARTWLTVWLVTRRPKELVAELNCPTSYRDARRFRFVTCGLLGAATVAIIGTLAFIGIRSRVAVDPWLLTHLLSAPSPGILMDVGMPLLFGWMFTPLTALLLIAATFGCGSVMPWLLNSPALPPVRRARAVALAHFLTAPLMIFPLLMLGWLGLLMPIALWPNLGGIDPMAPVWRGLTLGTELALVTALLLLVIRNAGFYRVAHRGGAGRWVAGAMLAVAGWVIVPVCLLVVVPWLVGAIWILWRGVS